MKNKIEWLPGSLIVDNNLIKWIDIAKECVNHTESCQP